MRTVIALYDDFSHANDAVRELTENGFPREDISLMANDANGTYGRSINARGTTEGTTTDSGAGEGASVGAGLGAAIGGIGGLLIGLGALAIPGIGPVVAAGPLAAALTGLAGAGAGAVAGGITGGLLGALVDMGVPEEAANTYAEGVRRGGTLLSVRASDTMSDQAVSILNRHHPVDVNQRAEEWRRSGWKTFNPDEQPYQQGTQGQVGDKQRDASYTSMGSTIPVTGDDDETTRGYGGTGTGPSSGMGSGYASGTSGDISTGTTYQGSDSSQYGSGRTQQGRDNELGGAGSEYQSGRGGIGSDADMRDRGMSHEGDQKQSDWSPSSTHGGDYDAMNRNANASGVDTSMSGYGGREETGSYDDKTRMGSSASGAPYGTGGARYNDFSAYDPTFRNHFATSMYASDYTYDQFQPAYHYGYDLAVDERYRGRDWRDLEMDAQNDWESRHPGTWDRFKDSIRQAWQEIKDTVS